MQINIKKLNEKANLPTRGSEFAAGWDLYACLDEAVTVEPRSVAKINTGIAMEIPVGYFGGVYPRSGLATKQGLRLANTTGVIDADYRGEIIVCIFNDSNETRVIEPNERIAQIIIQPFLNINFVETDELNETKRGTGGFGSTGTK